MKSLGEKWCKARDTWATKTHGDESARRGDGEGVARARDGGGAKKARTMYCVKCSDVKGQQKSRRADAKWAESAGKVR
eukprot:2609468-Pyramimonas_sp.AAC.1